MDRQRLEQALIAADAAGDVDAARQLAAAIRGTSAPSAADFMRSNPGEYDSSSEEYQSKYGPTGGTIENMLAGAGKAQTDIVRGARQFSTELGRMMGLGFVDPDNFGEEAVESQRSEIDAARERDAPLMDTKAGIAGNIGGSAISAAPVAFVPGANTAVGAGLTGAMLGATAPVGTGEDRGLNTALGFGGGAAGKVIGDKIGAAASRALTRAPNTASASVGPSASGASASAQGSVNLAARGGGAGFGSLGPDPSAGISHAQRSALAGGQSVGMKATPGQATGSKVLQQLEAKLESQPMTSGPFFKIKDNNQKALNGEWAKMIGEKSDEVSTAVLQKADDRIGNVFESVRDDRVRTIDPAGFVQKMRDVSDEFEAIGPQVWGNPLVKRFVTMAEKGSATGKDLGSLTSKFGREATKQMTSQSGDRDLGRALFQVKDYVDDLVAQGLKGEELGAYNEARKQYRNLMLLTQRVNVTNPNTGNVSALNLANVLMQKDKRGFTLGENQSDAYKAVRFAQAFKPLVGDSGTATRSMITNPIEIALAAPFNIATRAYTSSPAVKAAVAAQAAGQGTSDVLAPILAPTAPYLPLLGGLGSTYPARQ
jgi:hypothetical protein